MRTMPNGVENMGRMIGGTAMVMDESAGRRASRSRTSAVPLDQSELVNRNRRVQKSQRSCRGRRAGAADVIVRVGMAEGRAVCTSAQSAAGREARRVVPMGLLRHVLIQSRVGPRTAA